MSGKKLVFNFLAAIRNNSHQIVFKNSPKTELETYCDVR